MAEYRDFIPFNVATKGARHIGVYDAQGLRVGQIPLGTLTPPEPNRRLYSFGAISDVHIGYDTAVSDFETALTYFAEDNNVQFTCICGDLSGSATDAELSQYKSIVDSYSGGKPVYAIAGNHEGMVSGVESRISTYTGHPLFYSFTRGDDVFIMAGTLGGEMYSGGVVFADGELDWLENMLETNKSKRCFVFQHIYPGVENEAACGNAGGVYTNWCWHDTAECIRFEDLMKQYPGVIWFHGHSHMRFNRQIKADYANISTADGYRSVHIPSITVPRDDANNDGTAESVYAGSEGYVVDVYPDGIHLRGRDFVRGEFLPIASYWLST